MQSALDQIRHCSAPQALAAPQSNGSWLRLDGSFHVSGYIRSLPLADMCKRCPVLRLLLPFQRGWRSIGKMLGDEPTWIVSIISKPCLRYKEVFSVFEDQR